MTDECQMRNLHAPRARVIIHFKDGGVNDDMRSGADWRGEERSTKRTREREGEREEVRVVIST